MTFDKTLQLAKRVDEKLVEGLESRFTATGLLLSSPGVCVSRCRRQSLFPKGIMSDSIKQHGTPAVFLTLLEIYIRALEEWESVELDPFHLTEHHRLLIQLFAFDEDVGCSGLSADDRA